MLKCLCKHNKTSHLSTGGFSQESSGDSTIQGHYKFSFFNCHTYSKLKKKLFMYVAVPGLSCSMWNL